MIPTPESTDVETGRRRSASQAAQPVRRPSFADVDLDPARRPGALRTREPKPFPNTRFPPERQQGQPAVPRHNRPDKPMPPVFGTATPLHGLSGMVRRAAYDLPDHDPSHWLLLMLGDRVESWGTRATRLLPIGLPALGAFALVRMLRR